ncbi:unnamed protein product [Clonostachys byssicola]|uniref:Uncharacterized protein n=1 Tax=Clonostachys byssicola TaxID=160290 RepID=A0A9N9UBX7_9HYPO|nr:unnamed protein product [Clonostachys byssicola]
MEFAALPSWADMVGQLAGHVPSMNRPPWSEEDWTTWGQPSAPWTLWLEPAAEGDPSFVQFKDEGDMADHVVWEGARGYGIVRPTRPVSPLDMDAPQANWTLLHDMMFIRMECEQLHPKFYSKAIDDEMGPMLSVKLSDADGCNATIQLRGSQVTNVRRAEFGRTLNNIKYGFERLIDINQGDYEKRFHNGRERLLKYIKTYESAETLDFFAPSWVPANPEGKGPVSCSRRHFVAGTADPMVPSDLTTEEWPLFAASCSVKYDTVPVPLKIIGSASDSSFRRVPGHIHHYTSYALRLDTEAERDILPPELTPLEDSVARRIDKIFRDDIGALDLVDELYATQLMRSRIVAGSLAASNNKFAVVNAANLYLSMVAGHVATASASALDQLFSMNPTQLQTLVVQQETQVGTLTPSPNHPGLDFKLLPIWVVIFVCILISHIVCDGAPSGIPWDISSIAARIALLCHSSLPSVYPVPAEPGSIFTLRPLRFGYWKDNGKQEQHWCADTQLYQPRRRGLDLPEGYRFNSDSTPWFLGFTVFGVLFPCSCIAAILSFRHAHRRSDIPFNHSEEQSLRELAPSYRLHFSSFHPTPYGDLFWLAMLPLSIGFAIIWYWESVLRYYTMRQPWAGLYQEGPSKSNLTLDYCNCWFPMLKAFRNRHYKIAYLHVGLAIIALAPLLVNHYFYFDLVPQRLDSVTTDIHYDWSYDKGIQINDTTLDSMQSALAKSVLGMTNASALPKWSSFHEALLPVPLPSLVGPGKALSEEKNGSWSLTTRMVQAQLSCEAAVHEAIPGSSQHPRVLSVSFPNGLRDVHGNTSSFFNPCGDDSSQNPRDQVDDAVLCSTWTYRELVDLKNDKVVPRWIIAASQGTHTRTVAQQSGPGPASTSTAWICAPTLWGGNGTAQLLSWSPDQNIADAFVYKFKVEDEYILESDLARNFSQLLQATISEDRKVLGAIRLGQLVSTESFRGDILSYMAYRWALSRGERFDVDFFKDFASVVFSTVFAASVSEVKLFVEPSERTVEITPIVQAARLRIRGSVSVLCIILLCASVLGMFVYGVIFYHERQYVFPFAPEPLENSFHFLYRSTLLDIFKQIKNPELKSLKQFYKAVDQLNLTYFFGLPVDGDTSDFRVDVTAEIKPRHSDTATDPERQGLLHQDDSDSDEAEDGDEDDHPDDPLPSIQTRHE